MTERDVRYGVITAMTLFREAEDSARGRRESLELWVREAHKAGVSADQLAEWAGVSRRTIYNMLEETKS